MKTKITIIIISILFFSCASNEVIRGSGNLVEQELDIASFDKIEIHLSTDVNLTQSNTQSATLIADDNVINDISTEVIDNTLIIKYRFDNTSYRNTATTINIAIPVINFIKITGSSRFTISNFNTIDHLTIHNTGSTDMTLTNIAIANELHLDNSGSFKFRANSIVQNFYISNSGSQKVYCFDFVANNCYISNSGSGRVEVFCSDNLNITNSGSTDIYYKGYPNLNISSTGSGNVISAN